MKEVVEMKQAVILPLGVVASNGMYFPIGAKIWRDESKEHKITDDSGRVIGTAKNFGSRSDAIVADIEIEKEFVDFAIRPRVELDIKNRYFFGGKYVIKEATVIGIDAIPKSKDIFERLGGDVNE